MSVPAPVLPVLHPKCVASSATSLEAAKDNSQRDSLLHSPDSRGKFPVLGTGVGVVVR